MAPQTAARIDALRRTRDAAQAALADARRGGFHPTRYAAERAAYMLAESELRAALIAARRSPRT